jgi:predicted phosphodiesterase
MIIFACSDLHISPGFFSENAKRFLTQAAHQKADYTLLCGDIFEGTHTVLEKSILSDNGKEALDLIVHQRNPILILGNHDWTLKQVMADPKVRLEPDIKELLAQKPLQVLRSCLVPVGGRTLYATHGWAEYDRPCGWLAPVYHHVVPALTWAAKVLNVLSPGQLKARIAKADGGRSGFWEWWYLRRERGAGSRAILDARRNNYIPIWGHTHRRQIDFFEDWLAINCGDFVQDEIGGVVIEDAKVWLWDRDGCSATFELPRPEHGLVESGHQYSTRRQVR